MYLELRAYGIAKKFGKVTYLGKQVPKARATSVVQSPYSLEPNSGTLLMADSMPWFPKLSLVAICNYGVPRATTFTQFLRTLDLNAH